MSYNSLFGLGTHAEDASLEGWWPCQDNTASTTVVDESSNARNGTIELAGNSADLATSGPKGYLVSAFNMPGTSGRRINVGAATYLHGVAGFTALCWINPSTSDGADEGIISDWNATGNGHLLFRRDDDDLELFVNSSTQVGGAVSNANNVAASAWKSIAGRYDGSNITSFIGGVASGVSIADTGALVSTATNALMLAGTPHAATSTFNGLFCGAAVFSRSLTDLEIEEWNDGPEPLNTVAPAISGTQTEGQILTSTSGTWDSQGNGTLSYAYQWTRSNDAGGTGEADIGGATASTYTLVAGDVGKFIRCRARASNDGGFDSAEDTNSNMSGAISAGGGGTSLPVLYKDSFNAGMLSMSGGIR